LFFGVTGLIKTGSNMINKKLTHPAGGMKTENGIVYPMPTLGKQILVLVVSFFAAILLGFIISSIPGDLSDLATGVLYFVFIIIFILGYSIWISWMKLKILNAFKKTILKGVKNILTKNEAGFKNDLSFPEEKVLELLLVSQKSTKVFAIIGWVLGVLGGIISFSFDTSINKPILFVLVIIFASGFGHLLYYFGRRGYFPFPEE
jgi:MFS family permease